MLKMFSLQVCQQLHLKNYYDRHMKYMPFSDLHETHEIEIEDK